MSGYYNVGKQVLLGRMNIAQADDVPTAQMIVEALNRVKPRLPERDTSSPLIDDDTVWTEVALGPQPETYRELMTESWPTPITVPGTLHTIRQEGDEFACKCGVRWDVSEGEEHP